MARKATDSTRFAAAAALLRKAAAKHPSHLLPQGFSRDVDAVKVVSRCPALTSKCMSLEPQEWTRCNGYFEVQYYIGRNLIHSNKQELFSTPSKEGEAKLMGIFG